MNHPCKDCPNFIDDKCCHEFKIYLSNSAKNETQADLSVESGSREFLKGDVVIFKAADELDNLFTIIDLMVLDEKDFANLEAECFYHDGYLNELRHATPAEIKAGHRIDFNLNDTIATAFDDLGDDKHIENHVAPQCVVWGEK